MSAVEEEDKVPRGPTILLAAGGTGGHLFPAEALARELVRRGCSVELVSDDRVADFADSFPADAIHEITSGTVTGGGIGDKIKGAMALAKGVWECRGLLKELRPKAVVGFGGYPTVPPVLAAIMLKIPTVIHEQNAVMGRANKFMSGRVDRIATGFDIDDDENGFVHVGNPVRESVLQAARIEMPPALKGGRLRLLVFGGSQGARIMGEIVPVAIEKLPLEFRKRLHITQQAREEDMLRVKSDYARMGVDNECAPFFKDLPKRIAESHLIIGRSGASTVAELSVIGRPSILVPLPGSLDQDQAANAAIFADEGAAEIMMQKVFTPDALAKRLTEILNDPEPLMDIAAKAKAMGISDAASRLADVVLKVAGIKNLVKPTV
jgi:UDP-N-acetylglucosamine--N-acetylmuramyl-(pentapeptide) pyrophosphoryl-undecaprenol N-acetylglucosamine transferase